MMPEQIMDAVNFDPLDYDCPACPAKERQWCAPDWPNSERVLIGFTHEQRTSYNTVNSTTGKPATRAQWDAALKRDTHF